MESSHPSSSSSSPDERASSSSSSLKKNYNSRIHLPIFAAADCALKTRNECWTNSMSNYLRSSSSSVNCRLWTVLPSPIGWEGPKTSGKFPLVFNASGCWVPFMFWKETSKTRFYKIPAAKFSKIQNFLNNFQNIAFWKFSKLSKRIQIA